MFTGVAGVVIGILAVISLAYVRFEGETKTGFWTGEDGTGVDVYLQGLGLWGER